ncbi:hypothetical protein [Alloalcanivorax venustensis]|uniref:hypothetical protein n=1 Tax=Alloalcanivorax venustensis TaxID=172371 RepID=UPI0039E58A39
MSIKLEKISESGKKATYNLYGTTDKELVYQYGITSVFLSDDETYLEVKTSSKRDAAALSRMQADLQSATTETEPTKPAQTGTRRPELVEVAERDALNRGNGWIASEYDVDRLSLDPSWAGRAICYVYE